MRLTVSGHDRRSCHRCELPVDPLLPSTFLFGAVAATQLGVAVGSREVERFLDGLRVAIEAHSDSPADGLGAAAMFVIEHGRANAVLVAVLLSDRSLEGWASARR